MKAGSGCGSIAVYIDSKRYASISIATDVNRYAAYIGKRGVSRLHKGVNDGRASIGDTRPARWSMRGGIGAQFGTRFVLAPSHPQSDVKFGYSGWN